MNTEYDKMLSGEVYNAIDEGLLKDLNDSKETSSPSASARKPATTASPSRSSATTNIRNYPKPTRWPKR